MTQTSFASLQTTPLGVSRGEPGSQSKALAGLPPEALLAEALRIIRYELDLPGYERRRHILHRLRGWLEMDHSQARRLAVAFEDCRSVLEATEQDELAAAEEDAVMDGLSYFEFQELARFM